MSILDKVKDIVTLSYQPNETEHFSSQTGGTSERESLGGEEGISRASADDLETVFAKDPVIFSGVNLISNEVVSPGFYLDGENTDEVEDWLLNIHAEEILKKIQKWKIVYGNSYIELLWNISGSKIVDLVVMDSKSTDVVRDNKGNPERKNGGLVGYVQKQGAKEKKFTEEEYPDRHPKVISFPHTELVEGEKGIGLVEPLLNSEEIKLNLEHSTGEVAYRLGLPLLHASLGSDTTAYPSDNQISAFREELEGVHNKNILVTPYDVDIELLQPKEIKALQGILEYFRLQIAAGLGIPSMFLYGKGGEVNKATSRTLVEQFYKNIKSYQRSLASQFQRVIDRYCEERGIEAPRFAFRDPTIESLDTLADRLESYTKSGLITPDISLEEFIRDREGLPGEPSRIDTESMDKKTAIPVEEDGETEVDVFARAPAFLVNGELKSNPFKDTTTGARVKVADWLDEIGVGVVVSKVIGANAKNRLQDLGIEIVEEYPE